MGPKNHLTIFLTRVLTPASTDLERRPCDTSGGGSMTVPDRPLTLIVRLFPVAADRVRGVVEIVRTGQKYPVRGAEDVARVIAGALAGCGEAESRSGQHGSLQHTPEGDRRGDHKQPGAMLSSASSALRIAAMHPLQPMRVLVDQTLRELSPAFTRLDARVGRSSISPEPLLRALLLQLLYSMRGERLFMEQLEYNLLFRWFVGLSMDEPAWDHTVFTQNRKRLLDGEMAQEFFDRVLAQARPQGLLSDEHFTVDTTLIEAWASLKSVTREGQPAPPSSDPGIPP